MHVWIAIPEPFFNPGIRDWEIYNPGIQGSRRDFRKAVIISRIMIVTIYIGCYNKLGQPMVVVSHCTCS